MKLYHCPANIIFEELKDAEVIACLMETSFPNLKGLRFKNCEIESIEVLCRLHVPSLQGINLNGNFITSIKAVRKCHWPSLNNISVCNCLFICQATTSSHKPTHCAVCMVLKLSAIIWNHGLMKDSSKAIHNGYSNSKHTQIVYTFVLWR